MVTERLEVRLDVESRRMLVELARRRGIPLSALIRELVREAYEGAAVIEGLAAVRRISEANLEVIPEPEELYRQLDRTQD